MLTGNLVLARVTKQRVLPRYLDRESENWLECAESLLLIFRESLGKTRGEIQDEVEGLIGEGGGLETLTHRGLAKVLEDRAEFEVVADLPPDQVRERVFSAAATLRREQKAAGRRVPFRSEVVLNQVAAELGIDAVKVDQALFADLKDENRMLRFDDMSAVALIDRYNVALAQAVLLRSVQVNIEIRGETPARYRQLFHMLKFHRLLYRVDGDSKQGFRLRIDGPLSLFNSTTRYGMQIALFLPALLLFRDFRLESELRWGPKREPNAFYLDSRDGLISYQQPRGQYVPAEIEAFLDRLRQVAPDWRLDRSPDIVALGREGVWVPDFRFVHEETGLDVFVEILGFWKKSNLERLLNVLPLHGPPRYLLAVSDRLKVDEASIDELSGPILKFKEIPNASEFAAFLRGLLPR